jgi:hypothetical protein
VLSRLVEVKRIPPRFEFTVGFVIVIITTNSRVMQRFIALGGLLVSLVPADADSQPPKKSLLAFNRERCDFCR